MLKLMLADNFFNDEDLQKLFNIVSTLQFTDKEYGQEIENFNLISPNVSELFSNVFGHKVEVDEEQSGIFRKPMDCLIHFEGFDNINEWCFMVALYPSTFNVYHHTSGAKSALDGYKFNYRNMFEWDYDVNIQLKPNQGVFFRPWLFHSIENGIVQYFKIKG